MDDMLRGLDVDESDRFIPTGLRDVDELMGGMRRGDLLYWAVGQTWARRPSASALASTRPRRATMFFFILWRWTRTRW